MIDVLLSLLLASGTAGAASPAMASDASPVVGDARKLRKAEAVSELLHPRGLMVRSNMRGWESGIANALKLDPATAKLEAAHPGILKAAIDAARPIGLRYCEEHVDKAVSLKVRLIAERLTDAELEAAIAGFGKPFWKRFVTRMAGNMDPDAIARDAAANIAETGKPAITKDAIDRTTSRAVRQTADDISAEDQLEIMRLAQSSFAPKLTGIAAETDRVVLEWINNPDPAFVAKQQETMRAAMLAFADARKP